MSEREMTLLLEDMLESAYKISRYSENLSLDLFMTDDKTKDAVVRNFEIIGEAANRVDVEFRMKNPDVKWNRLRGFRNRIVHDYFGIDYQIVWNIIENDLDSLIAKLEKMISDYGNN